MILSGPICSNLIPGCPQSLPQMKQKPYKPYYFKCMICQDECHHSRLSLSSYRQINSISNEQLFESVRARGPHGFGALGQETIVVHGLGACDNIRMHCSHPCFHKQRKHKGMAYCLFKQACLEKLIIENETWMWARTDIAQGGLSRDLKSIQEAIDGFGNIFLSSELKDVKNSFAEVDLHIALKKFLLASDKVDVLQAQIQRLNRMHKAQTE